MIVLATKCTLHITIRQIHDGFYLPFSNQLYIHLIVGEPKTEKILLQKRLKYVIVCIIVFPYDLDYVNSQKFSIIYIYIDVNVELKNQMHIGIIQLLFLLHKSLK